MYHFTETAVYDGSDPETGLFTKYINAFLKLKQQASGWPKWVKTAEDRSKYIVNYYKKEGIWLDEEKIEVNPALRTLAKLG